MTQETPPRDPMHVAAETAMEAVARRLAQHVGAPYGDLVMGPNRAALIAVDEAAPIIRDAVRAVVAEEIAGRIDALATATSSPAARLAWRSAVKLARECAVPPSVRPVDATADLPEGSGHPRPVLSLDTTPTDPGDNR